MRCWVSFHIFDMDSVGLFGFFTCHLKHNMLQLHLLGDFGKAILEENRWQFAMWQEFTSLEDGHSRSQTFLSTNFPSLEGCTVAMPVDFQTILIGCASGAYVVLFFSLGLMRLLRVQNLGEFLRQRHTTESPSTSLSIHAPIPTCLSSYILHLLLPSSRITWLLVKWAPPNSHTRGEADWLPYHDHWIFVR